MPAARIPVTDDTESDAAAIRRAIAIASQAQADIVLTLEGSASGHTHTLDPGVVERALGRLTIHSRGASIGHVLGARTTQARQAR